MPLWTTTQGVVWLPEQSVIRAGHDCEVIEVLAEVDQWAAKNAPLLRGTDPFLEAEVDIYRARIKELHASYNAQPVTERVKRKMLQEEIQRVRGDLDQAEERLGKLLVRSPAQGNLVLIDPRHLPGRFVKEGQLLGYIVTEQRPTVRAVVGQADVGLVREGVTGVEVRLAERPSVGMKAEIVRIVPAADLNLPSAALGTAGGGIIPVDPSDPKGLRALESHFQLDLHIPEEGNNPYIGGRVYVRIEHGSMPLSTQWYRSLRQLFLRRFYA
jgi:putative peptide zinc metalloprotease protein